MVTMHWRPMDATVADPEGFPLDPFAQLTMRGWAWRVELKQAGSAMAF
jgi:hypothetical protein